MSRFTTIFPWLRPRRSGALVLMYHRIGNPPGADPWDLFVSEEHFGEQLSLLKKEFRVVPLLQLVEWVIKRRPIPERTICLTFDDGYQDNYERAMPLLEKYQLPATFFIVTGMMGKEGYWWDRLLDLLLAPGLLNTTERKALLQWRWPEEPPAAAVRWFLDRWTALKPMPLAAIEQSLDSDPGPGPGNFLPAATDNRIMNWSTLHMMVRNPLFTAGVHTVTHPALGSHPAALQRQELTEGFRELKEKIHPTSLIPVAAYPYGSYNGDTLQLMPTTGLLAGFTTESKAVQHTDDPYRLGRIVVKDEGITEFRKMLYSYQ